jgi:hypothetical protein
MMKEKIISNKGLLFLVLLCSPLYAEVNITTLSDWDINDFDEHTLLVAKTSDNSQAWKSLLAFHVSRPHCVSLRCASSSNHIAKTIISALCDSLSRRCIALPSVRTSCKTSLILKTTPHAT